MKNENWKIHPLAEMFPMMSEEELDELASDIKTNGLRHPIVRDKDDQIIDGRNRLEACKRARIEPEFILLEDGKDPVAFIISENVTRRHLTKGQRAMLAAKAKKSQDGSSGTNAFSGSSGTIRQFEEQLKVSHTGIAKALVILQFAPDLEPLIMSGAMPLNEGYEKARERQIDANSDEALMFKLKRDAPDLANEVAEEKLSLIDAIKALEERNEQRRRRCRSVAGSLDNILIFTGAISASTPESMIEELKKYLEPESFTANLKEANSETFKRAIKVLSGLTKDWKK